MINVRSYLAFILMGSLGTRGGETGKFTREDIKFPLNGIPYIELKSSYTKSGEFRRIPLPRWGCRKKSLFEKLFMLYYEHHEKNIEPRYLKKNPDGPPLPFFCTQKYNPCGSSAWRTAFKELFIQHGAPEAYTHDLRSKSITSLLESGFSTIEVSIISGHESLEMVKRYHRPGEEGNTVSKVAAHLSQ